MSSIRIYGYWENIMNRMLKHSSAFVVTGFHKSLKEHKRKTLHALLLGFVFLAAAMLGIVFILRFIAPHVVTIQDQQFLIRGSIVILLGSLGIALLEQYLSYDAASIGFNLLIIAGILLS